MIGKIDILLLRIAGQLRFAQVVAVALVLFIAACADEKVAKRSYPVVNTDDVLDVTEQGVTFNGEILDIGEGASDHGFYFSHSGVQSYPFPPTGIQISLGPADAAGKFSTFANRGMASGETYYVRAYAISTTSTAVLGQERQFVSKGSIGPEIKDFNPKEAIIGDTVVITGSGFNNVSSAVLIGQSGSTPILKAKPDSLWVQMPFNAAVGENTVKVTVGQQSVTAAQKLILPQITITSFEPASLSFGDTLIIHGTNFPIVDYSSYSRVFGQVLNPYTRSRTEFKTVVLYDQTSTSSAVEITAGTQVIQSASQIQLLPPKITAFTPAKGSKDTEVTITGDYFHITPSKNIVMMAGIKLSVVFTSRKSLKVMIPGGIEPGLYSLSITTAGQPTTSVTNFEIIQPVITNISPPNGTWGTEVTITGMNFGPTIADNVVYFSTSGSYFLATIKSASETQLKVIVPAGVDSKLSTIKVGVLTAENRFATFSSFTLDAPVVSSFAPTEGKTLSVVTITGSNFYPIAIWNTVRFGNTVAEIIDGSGTQLSVKVPVMPDTEATISVTTSEQTGESPNTFHVISPWRRIKDYPGAGRADATSFVLNNEGYVGLGGVTGIIKDFWKYNPTNDSWTAVQSFSTETSAGFIQACSFEIGGFAYVGGAQPEPSVFRKYDPIANAWTTIAPLPVTSVYNSVGFAIDGKGYVATGTLDVDTGAIPCCFGASLIWEYDPASDAWTSKANLPAVGRTGATSFTIDSRPYVVGGRSHNTYGTIYKQTWEFNPAADQWTARAPWGLPAGDWRSPLAFAVNGKGYVLGYHNDYTGLGDFAWYDPVLDQWTELTGYPFGFVSPVAFVIGDKAYIGLGTNLWDGEVRNDFWEFDPSKL